MRELRHDFRATYHVSYEDVPVDEAIDLALTLGYGTAYGAAMMPDMAWSLAQYQNANIIDLLNIIVWLEEGHPRAHMPTPVPRPGDKARHEREQKKAADVADTLNNTRWEDIGCQERI